MSRIVDPRSICEVMFLAYKECEAVNNGDGVSFIMFGDIHIGPSGMRALPLGGIFKSCYRIPIFCVSS